MKEPQIGYEIKRHFTLNGSVFNNPDFYELRDAIIKDSDGNIIFEQNNIESPKSWDNLSLQIIASKYFKRSGLNTPEGKEISVKQPINRISNTITKEGLKLGYFSSEAEANIFNDELKEILITQRAAFNSPVWFNCGLYHEYGIKHGHGNYYYDHNIDQVLKTESDYEKPQVSACFIQSVDDSIDGITDLIKSEAQLFKFGSGTGTNFSNIRSNGEHVSGGGKASGVLSFLKPLDANAGTVKSGGISRRAAKMVVLDVDHPEIMDFIEFKAKEEKKAQALIAAGYDSHYEGEAYTTINGQNANNSISVSDEFMQAVENDKEFSTTYRTTGEIAKTYKAKDILMAAAKAAWECADPGIQYNGTMNYWNTRSNTGKIRATNPCSEYISLDDTACNLASLNLIHFINIKTGIFDVKSYIHTIYVTILAQEILCAIASYPTEKIARNAYKYRELGIGYANLGALLMQCGIPYDSEEGRIICGNITSILSGYAYYMSAKIADKIGSFEGYQLNKNSMNNVIKQHYVKAQELYDQVNALEINFSRYPLFDTILNSLYKESLLGWRMCVEDACNGFRNAQISCLAPTGTIGLLMGCDTTGIEPDFSIVKYKKLSGGGNIKIVNNSVSNGLRNLGYTEDNISAIEEYIINNDTIENCPLISEMHLPVFDCATKTSTGARYLKPESHLYMMAAAQPFISGAISKTANIPNESTIEDVYNLYILGYKLGLKAIAIYRDGCKKSQPLNTSKDKKDIKEEVNIYNNTPVRKRLPVTRKGITTEARIDGHKMYIRTGEYEDGNLGEIFVDISKEGSTLKGILNTWAMMFSISLQYGIPLSELIETFKYTKFEPQGWAKHDTINSCTSLIDFIVKWLEINYINNNIHTERIEEKKENVPVKKAFSIVHSDENIEHTKTEATSDAPFCTNCGFLTIRNASCYKCVNCGLSLGCS